MVESPQRVYVHDAYKIQDDGEEVYEVSLNTRGETPPSCRDRIYELVWDEGVDPAELFESVEKDIGTVWFTSDDEVDRVELEDWVVEEFA